MSIAGTAVKIGRGADPETAEPLLPVDIPHAFASRFGVTLTGENDGRLLVSLAAGFDPRALLKVRRYLSCPLDVTLDDGEEALAAGLLDFIIADAAHQGVSYIHIEPSDSGVAIRMRLNGGLRETLRMPVDTAPTLVNRIKVMAKLDLAERLLPQQGRIALPLGGMLRDLCVSTLPGRLGERIVLRILDKGEVGGDLHVPGMPAAVNMLYRAALAERRGLVILAGPKKSGKTTSAYAGLRQLNADSRVILTAEDPIDELIKGIHQVEVGARLTFPDGLRAILRQDPDVVMAGEIRDSETAEIAVQASATGQLVLATIHAEDAVGAITRLRDFRIEPFLLASTLRTVIAQRVARRLCAACRTPIQTSAAESALLGFDTGTTIYQARGCHQCGNSGYKGRIGVFEAIGVDETIRRLINNGGDEAVIAGHVFRQSQNIGSAARSLVLEGVTTAEEAIRISRRESEDD
jgi:general secretion pathway protein E